jgi:NADH-quinone oxidoreductase subunit M
MNRFPLLTLLTLLPLCGGVVVLAAGSSMRDQGRRLAIGFALASLVLALMLCAGFQPQVGSFQFVERYSWVPDLAVQYHLGLDGFSLLLVLLTAIVVPMSMAAAWRIAERPSVYFGLVLLLEAGLFGTFTALNFFHWFLYWELSLIPAFFLVRLWGGAGRAAAAFQFFVYTMVGSVALLLTFLAIFLATGQFDFVELARMAREGTLGTALTTKLGWVNLTSKELLVVIFSGAFLGFAVKVPLVPFHTWLPDAYTEASTGTSMLLTGLLSKMGVYGFVRILLPIFPEQIQWLSKPLLVLAVLTIVFSAGAAFAQRDLKRILAYSSINHLGYCVLGVFAVVGTGSGLALDPGTERAAALNGVFLQVFNHGLTASMLFWFVGLLENRTGGRRSLDDFGGMRKKTPVLCGLMGIALFSSLGLPGLNGFVGEFLIFRGTFALASWAAVVSLLGLLITAIFILGVLQRVFFGPLRQEITGVPDLTMSERLLLAPAIGLFFVLGLYPQALIGLFNTTVRQFVDTLR